MIVTIPEKERERRRKLPLWAQLQFEALEKEVNRYKGKVEFLLSESPEDANVLAESPHWDQLDQRIGVDVAIRFLTASGSITIRHTPDREALDITTGWQHRTVIISTYGGFEVRAEVR